MSAILATLLSRQGKHTEAMEVLREVVVSRTRLLDADHENTLISATNLAILLAQRGQNK